ncbi:TBC domain-containing protein [Cardiosporidium cionae]|uniref:TBC domain-containing protein n=1 Tax=Cardiosporidium cionae TaxID=476202 RepID=A0ABQ7J7Y9_9APIC|nr:TBC domain-containing protein [Cardiosporidium cionae]|eukprot:KAF8820092.1 TBC domain-containing protein [Cardiosporidium cionae]
MSSFPVWPYPLSLPLRSFNFTPIQTSQCSCVRSYDGGCTRFRKWWRILQVETFFQPLLYDSICHLLRTNYPAEDENGIPCVEVSQREFALKSLLAPAAMNPSRDYTRKISDKSENQTPTQVDDYSNTMTTSKASSGILLTEHKFPYIPHVSNFPVSDPHENSDSLEQRAHVTCAEIILGRYVHRCILLDITRTFPALDFYKGKGADQLQRILEAYAFYDPDVGYVQGMNFVAGFLLWHSNEQQAFWMLVTIMQSLDVRTMYLRHFPGLIKRCAIVETLLSISVPKLFLHLEMSGIDAVLFASEWFLTLFASSVPFEPLNRIWDEFFEEGWSSIYKLIIQRCLMLRYKIMINKETDAILGIIKYDNPSGKVTRKDVNLRSLRNSFTAEAILEQRLKSVNMAVSGRDLVSNTINRIQGLLYKAGVGRHVEEDLNSVESWMELIEGSRQYNLDRNAVQDLETYSDKSSALLNINHFNSLMKRFTHPENENSSVSQFFSMLGSKLNISSNKEKPPVDLQEKSCESFEELSDHPNKNITGANVALNGGPAVEASCVSLSGEDISNSQEVSLDYSKERDPSVEEEPLRDETQFIEGLLVEKEDSDSMSSWESIESVNALALSASYPPSSENEAISPVAMKVAARIDAAESAPRVCASAYDLVLNDLKARGFDELSLLLQKLRKQCDTHREKDCVAAAERRSLIKAVQHFEAQRKIASNRKSNSKFYGPSL